MDYISILPFSSVLVCILTGAFVLFRRPNAFANRSFFFLSCLCVFQSLVDFGYFQSRSIEQAHAWWQLDVVWPFLLVSMGYISIALSGHHRLLKKTITHLFLVPPALFFCFADAWQHAITREPIAHAWGWSYGGVQNTIIADVSSVWSFLVQVGALALFVHQYVTTCDTVQKQRAKVLGLAPVVTLAYSIFEIISCKLSTEIGVGGTFSAAVTVANAIMACAIWKYDIFALSPINVADNIVTAIEDTMLLINIDKRIESHNTAALDVLEYSPNELTGMPIEELFTNNADKPAWITTDSPTAMDGEIRYMDTRMTSKTGKRLPVSIASSRIHNAHGHPIGYLVIARDIEERNRREQELKVFKNQLERLVEKRTEQLASSLDSVRKEVSERKKIEVERATLERERESLETELFHAQKLETIGRLAGGVAHDFNNLLFVINSYAEEFLNALNESDPLYEDFTEIHQAAERATALTQQLLAFSRKQITTPVIVDPNESMSGLYKMLSRILGKNIQLNIIPGLNVGKIKIDPGQLDQVLINLAINAKDAIVAAGTITVEVNQVTLTEAECSKQGDRSPGRYVLMVFTDDGVGMDRETQSQIFEPFFTTKAPGKGTGLGLSTIYGIMKQNDGFLEVSSSPGRGSTFKLYFPEYTPDCETKQPPRQNAIPTGHETILLVEDDTQVRRLAARLLNQLGYRVLEASGATEATRIFQEKQSDIDLLFTDVIMPGMNGKQLSRRLVSTQGDLKVLYMSGYNEEITDHLGRVDTATCFIAKPFSSDALSLKVREVLDA